MDQKGLKIDGLAITAKEEEKDGTFSSQIHSLMHQSKSSLH